MNGEPAKIEILAPFGAAFEWMKAMLFRPFDVARWLTIAFAAFLSGSWGSGLNFRWGRWGRGDWNYRWHRHGDLSDLSITPWLIALLVVGVLIALVLVFVWMWVTSRGRFIFTDCVVKNRAAIVEPWREFRREGNSFFLFSLAVALVMIILSAILVLMIVAVLRLFSDHEGPFVALVLGLIVLGCVWLAFALFFALVSNFMVPVMYRRRCSAREAFLDVAKLMLHNPGPFILFVLFGIVLVIAVGIVGTIVACLTCCIGGLPYVSTVLLLPAIVWLLAFKLLFLRQFGDAYDVWATVGFPAPPPAPPLPPAPIAPA
jgi:hypothetical protein